MLKETLEYKVSFPSLLFPLLDEADKAVERTFFSLMFFPLSPPDFVHHSISLLALSQLLQFWLAPTLNIFPPGLGCSSAVKCLPRNMQSLRQHNRPHEIAKASA